MPTSLDSIFFAGPYLLCWSHRSGVRCQLPLSVIPRQLSLLSRRQLPASYFVQPTLFRIPFPLPDTARFQVQKSFVWFRAKTDKGIVRLEGHPYSVTPFEVISSGCNALVVPLQLLEGPREVLLCERANDLRHSLFHLLNCLITTASGLRE